ncbi:hypothetical protein FM107_05835 [Sphingobacterium sp. JB170]|nr:hypothetical protein FM107_05835 [Sphingobacterium sp. JB170]
MLPIGARDIEDPLTASSTESLMAAVSTPIFFNILIATPSPSRINPSKRCSVPM